MCCVLCAVLWGAVCFCVCAGRREREGAFFAGRRELCQRHAASQPPTKPTTPTTNKTKQVIKTATVPAAACKRANTMQFHDSGIKFPLTRRLLRPTAPEYKTVFKAVRPSVAMV